MIFLQKGQVVWCGGQTTCCVNPLFYAVILKAVPAANVRGTYFTMQLCFVNMMPKAYPEASIEIEISG